MRNAIPCWLLLGLAGFTGLGGCNSDDNGDATPPADASIYLSAGSEHTCGIRADNDEAQCWGENEKGQATPPKGVAFVALSAGHTHTCGIRADNGEAQCWGEDGKGQATPPKGVIFAH